jgi:hypothetical protein
MRTDIGRPADEPTSPHAAADAQRAIQHTNSWQPKFNRRQSWSKEDQKRALQMSAIDGITTGPGFSERPQSYTQYLDHVDAEAADAAGK